MGAMAERGALQSVSLRFLDGELERRYQDAAGAESIGGLRVITAVSAAVWAIAAVLVPIGTTLPAETVLPIAGLMTLVSLVAFVLSGWAKTLDRQHGLAAVLTAANAAVILALASLAGAFPGYGVAAIMLLYLFAFVSRTRFVFAAARSVVIAAAFLVAVLAYDGPESLALDGLFFVTATAGSLLALHILEHCPAPGVLPGPRHPRAVRGDRPGTREIRSAASQRDAGVDLGEASGGRVGSRRRVPVRHRDVCRHRRVHAIGRRAPGRGRRAAAQCALLIIRRPRRGTGPREDQDHRGQLHGGRRPPGTSRWARVADCRARAGHDRRGISSRRRAGPDQSPDRRPFRSRGGWGHRQAQDRLRRLGRHGERGQPPGGAGRGGSNPDQRGDMPPPRRGVRVGVARLDRPEGPWVHGDLSDRRTETLAPAPKDCRARSETAASP